MEIYVYNSRKKAAVRAEYLTFNIVDREFSITPDSTYAYVFGVSGDFNSTLHPFNKLRHSESDRVYQVRQFELAIQPQTDRLFLVPKKSKKAFCGWLANAEREV